MERHLPNAKELQRRREFYEQMAELRARQPESSGPFPTIEEMIREDRESGLSYQDDGDRTA
jgi:hypothetical protein